MNPDVVAWLDTRDGQDWLNQRFERLPVIRHGRIGRSGETLATIEPVPGTAAHARWRPMDPALPRTFAGSLEPRFDPCGRQPAEWSKNG